MRTRTVGWLALVVGALAFAGAVSAQQQAPAGGRHTREGAPRGANAAPAANAANPGNPGPGGPGGGGNPQWTPEQMQQMQERMQQRNAERMKTALGLTDEQWQAMQPKIEKVQALQREAEMVAGGGPARGGRMGPGGPGGAMMPGQGPGPGAAPQTELAKATQELQATLEIKDSTPEQISAKLKALRDARANLPQELSKARAALQQGLTPRQEAQLVMMGILQ